MCIATPDNKRVASKDLSAVLCNRRRRSPSSYDVSCPVRHTPIYIMAGFLKKRSGIGAERGEFLVRG